MQGWGKPIQIQIGVLLLMSCHQPLSVRADPCSQQWFQQVEATIASEDNQGHGPDIGSLEWRSVVEFKLGIRGQSGIPDRSSRQWCLYIEDYLHQHSLSDAQE